MGDLDIFVSDRQSAKQVLEELGFKCLEMNSAHEWCFYKNGFEIELHNKLFYGEPADLSIQYEYFNDYASSALEEGELDYNFTFLYLVAHLRKHLMNSGVGLRQFLDLAMMVEYCNSLDYNSIFIVAEKVGILSFLNVCLYFIKRWFHVEASNFSLYAKVEIPDDFYIEATSMVVKDGVFGVKNQYREENYTVNYIGKSRFPKLGMIFLFVKRLFPGYSDLIKSQKYSFLVNRPWLLPAGWVYRFVCSIRCNQHEKIIKKLTGSFINDEYFKNRQSYLEKWGIKL